MSLIYDSFDSRYDAGKFAAEVVSIWPEKTATVCASKTVSDVLDPFPGELRPYIVLVSRDDGEGAVIEDALAEIASRRGGAFVGT